MGAYSQQLTRVATSRQPVTAVLAGIAAVAGSFAAAGLTAAFAFTPLSSFVVHHTPSVVVNTTLDIFGAHGKLVNTGFALVLTVVLFVCASGVGLVLGRYVPYSRAPAAGLFVWLLGVGLTGAPLVSLGAALPAIAVVAFVYRPWEDDKKQTASRWPDSERRSVLETGFGLVGFTGAAYITGSYRTPSAPLPDLSELSSEDGAEASRLLDEAAQKSFALPDSPALVSQIGEFYTVDINTVAPRIDAKEWNLDVTGAVTTPLTLSYADLTEMETEQRFSTLRCVGEDLNAREMDTAVWTGVPARTLTEQAGASGEYVALHADDDYWNVIPRAAFEQSLLVFGMNDHVLPRAHGHPVRCIVPGRWGETNVKWLTEIEFLDEDIEGYWEERGWEGTGEISGITKLWTNHETEDGVLLGGHAFDGTDGVAAVELSLDGGTTWTEAELTDPLSVGDAWRQWRYEVTDSGEYDVVVRLVDGNGERQERENTGAFPDGATGWVRDTITVE
jgi:DMSO/TMAO reductase YedYZ molybdopterin-dependent catalytic subunit